MKTKLKIFFSAALAAALSFSAAACADTAVIEEVDNTSTQSTNSDQPTPSVDPETLVQLFGDFHTPLQAAYLLSPYDEATLYAKGNLELSRPQAVTLEWNEDTSAKTYFVQLATQEDFSDAVTYETTDPSYDLYNLYLGCDYYWRAASSSDELENAQVCSFTTTDAAPRNLYLDGVTNVRDLGGWLTESGARVRQGLLFRGGRLNTSDSDLFNLELTLDGVETFRDVLKIKTELDLRKSANNEVGSVDGYTVEGIDYVNIPLESPPINNPTNIIANNSEEVKQIFALLADESAYPVYFHCNIGTDRTGFVAFMVNALLGVKEEDLYRDYLFSNFGVVKGARTLTAFKALYADEINKYEGATFADRTAAYLTALGVITTEQIESIRAIML